MTDTPENFSDDESFDFEPETEVEAEAEPEEDKGERIAKVLARAGVCSRRDAERLIAERRVTVNGTVLDTPAFLVTPADTVAVDNVALKTPEQARVWRYHKPPGRVTTHKDPQGRPTVFEAMPREMPRVVSVGRLDLNSEGLLLLTNDGTLAGLLEHPSTGWIRRYRVRVYGTVSAERLEMLRDGVTVDGVRYGPVIAEMERQQGGNAWINVALTEGKNREIRKVMEHIGYRVNRLIRVAYGPFTLGRLDRGEVEEIPFKVLRDQLAGLGDVVPTELQRPKGRTALWAKAKPKPVKPGDKARAKAQAQGKSYERERPVLDENRPRGQGRAVERERPAPGTVRDRAPSRPFDRDRPKDGETRDRASSRPFDRDRPRDGETRDRAPSRPFDRDRPRDGETRDRAPSRPFDRDRPRDGETRDRAPSRPFDRDRPKDGGPRGKGPLRPGERNRDRGPDDEPRGDRGPGNRTPGNRTPGGKPSGGRGPGRGPGHGPGGGRATGGKPPRRTPGGGR